MSGAASARIGTASQPSGWQTVRRGLQLSPEFRRGLGWTLLLAILATAGRTAVPVAVQQTVDRGLSGGATDAGAVHLAVAYAALAVLVTAVAAYGMNARLIAAAESGLSTLRVAAFRHVHDLSVLTQDAERRGALVSRVTSDVDTISIFLQSGGLLLVLSAGQIVVATVVMATYSWQLTLLVWLSLLPFFFFLRLARRRVALAYAVVRVRVAEMLAAIGEAVTGARVVKAYAIQDRTARRIDTAVTAHYRSQVRAQRWVGGSSATGDLAWGAANCVVVLAGVSLGLGGALTAGQVLAMLFLVTLLVAPIQVGIEMLNEAQNAVAGWRRVLAVIDTPADVADPGDAGTDLPPGRLDLDVDDVTFSYPGGPPVVREVTVRLPAGRRVAVVGETGSGKTTFAKLLVRLIDPAAGAVSLGGVDLRQARAASLRRRMLLVPQEGFLFDRSLRDNLRLARPDATDADMMAAVADLGLADWFAGLPRGLDTPVGQRGEALSSGERQLVALAAAALVDPDVLVLDEATSAVDPATEKRLQAALGTLTRGRTSVIIAHRLSTAETADEILVFDAGRIVEQGHHEELVEAGGTYAQLHAAWRATAAGATQISAASAGSSA